MSIKLPSASNRKKPTSSSATTSAMNLRSFTPESPQKAPSSITATPKSPPNRLFTEKDEIKLLKSLLKSTKKAADPSSIQLSYGHFSQGQIDSKLKRLKEKYHKMARSKSLIKTPQDQKIYEIARKIWGPKSSIPSALPKNGEGNGGNSEAQPGKNGENSKTQDGENSEEKNGENSEDKNGENSEDKNGENIEKNGVKSGEGEVNLENFPFLMGAISGDVKEIGFYLEGLKNLGEEKLKELNEKWMVLSLQKAAIEAEKSMLYQKQFMLVAEACGGIV